MAEMSSEGGDVLGSDVLGGDVLAQHLITIVEQRLQKLVKSAKEAHAERSVDAVHELRVASRRLRAFVLTFRDEIGRKTRSRLEKRLRRVTKAVGALRDLDVLAALVQQRSASASTELERASLEHLLELLDERRLLAAPRAEKRLRKLDLDALSALVRSAAREVVDGLAAEEGQREYARTLLERRILAAAEQEPPRDGADHSEEPYSEQSYSEQSYSEQLHQLRLALKQLRYSLELLEPVLGAPFAALYARAESLQELLGKHHDLTVLGAIIAEQSDDLARKNRPTLAAGLQLADRALRAERQALLQRFLSRGFQCDWWLSELSRALEQA
jgi:CHAD domain-containing protein